MKYYYCIDIGGTGTKCGVIDENDKLVFFEKIKTAEILKSNNFAFALSQFLHTIEAKSGFLVDDSLGMGIGLPGLIDSPSGIVCYSRCLNLKNYKLVENLKKYFHVAIKISNDAELATQAELHYGIGKKIKNFVLLTLGTGVGCGIVIDGKSLRETRPLSCEFGHTKIFDDEFEQFASTKALEKQTALALTKNKQCEMWKSFSPETVNGTTIFKFLNDDKVAKEVFDKFVSYIGDGIVNIVNTFCPEAVVIGGSISAEKETLTKPIQDYVNNHTFTKNAGYTVKVVSAKMTRFSGIFGAKTLFI